MPAMPAIPPAVIVGIGHVAFIEGDHGAWSAHSCNPPSHVSVAVMLPVVVTRGVVHPIPTPIIRISPGMPAVPTITIPVAIRELAVADIDVHAEVQKGFRRRVHRKRRSCHFKSGNRTCQCNLHARSPQYLLFPS